MGGVARVFGILTFFSSTSGFLSSTLYEGPFKELTKKYKATLSQHSSYLLGSSFMKG